MYKRDLIKKLHSLGIRRAEKAGCGYVSLNHLKFAELAEMLYKIEKEKE